MTLTFYQILCLLGVPSLFTVCGWIYKKLKKNDEETKAVKYGLQALLRSQMNMLQFMQEKIVKTVGSNIMGLVRMVLWMIFMRNS